MRRSDEESFREFARHAFGGLRRMAFLLCGDWHVADDLVQTTLMKMFRSWSKIDRAEVPMHYARKVLLNCWLDERRRSWRRNERVSDSVPETEVVGADPVLFAERRETRDQLLRGLATLPRGQRAVLVLRYFEGLTIAEAARALGNTEGTVKSQTSRALTALTSALSAAELSGAGKGS